MVWSSAAKKDLVKLQLIQNRAARVALCCTKRTNINKMHATLGWPLVRDRLQISLLSFVRNISFSKLPSILYNQLNFSFVIHSYSTRHASQGLFVLPISNTNSMQHTVLYRAIKQLNSLPSKLTQSTSKLDFKKKLKKYFMESVSDHH